MNDAITSPAQPCTPGSTPDTPLRIQLSESPVLQRMQRALRTHFTRIWPTRRLALCPLARAGLVDSGALDLPALRAACATHKTLVVFLPGEFVPHLAALAQSAPAVLVHPDIGLARQRAYLSWCCPSHPGHLPLTLWVELDAVFKTLVEQRIDTGALSLPVVFVAGGAVAIGCIESPLNDRFDRALAMAERPVTGLTEQARAKAQVTAANYGEQPWLLMRYELKNENRRLAVIWAPVVRMHLDLAIAD